MDMGTWRGQAQDGICIFEIVTRLPRNMPTLFSCLEFLIRLK
jgi:hypothetical protein